MITATDFLDAADLDRALGLNCAVPLALMIQAIRALPHDERNEQLDAVDTLLRLTLRDFRMEPRQSSEEDLNRFETLVETLPWFFRR